jgi:hypothetical protein
MIRSLIIAAILKSLIQYQSCINLSFLNYIADVLFHIVR